MVGYKYRGKFSLIVLGELLLDILGLEDFSERQDALEFIQGLTKKKKIEYGVMTKTVDELATKIKTIDYSIEQADRLILGCASEDNAEYLVTLDTKLVENEKLETELHLKIKHPKYLV